MAKAKFVPIITKATGLCNTKDRARQSYDLKTGESQLSQAVQIDIDRSGRPSRCAGFTEKRTEAAHSGWSDSESCFYVSGTTLYRLWPDYSRTAVRTGLTTGARMRFASVANRVYYINGFELGYITGVQDNTWSAGTSGAPTSNVTYSNPPLGHLVAFAFGRVIIAFNNILLASEPSFYGRFNLAKFHGENKRITMLAAVEGGLFVGTEDTVAFYAGTKWEEVRRDVKMQSGVLEGSEAWTNPEELGLGLDVSGKIVVFTTNKGICLGGGGGLFRNLTEDNLALPKAHQASGAIHKDRYVVHIAP